MNATSKELKEIKRALVELFKDMPELCCENFHHNKKDYHSDRENCPVSIRHYTAIAKLRYFL